MNYLLKHWLHFIFPILLVAVLLFFMPYNRKFAYLSKNNIDCNTSWIYHRLFENKTNIDIAFIGTSHTGCGIDDGLIENKIDSITGKNIKVANLAYCGGGRNLDYVLLKDLISEKRPQTIIVEFKNDNDLIHRDYGIMASSSDLWFPSTIPYNYISTLYTGLKSRLNLVREQVVFGPKIEIDLKRDSAGVLDMKEEYTHQLTHQKKKKVITTINELSNHSFFGAFKNSVTEETIKEHLKHKVSFSTDDINCVKKMSEMAATKKIKFIFIYLPPFGNYHKDKIATSSYSKYGTMLFPPESMFKDRSFWVDPEHLNLKGATFLSEWLSSQYEQILE